MITYFLAGKLQTIHIKDIYPISEELWYCIGQINLAISNHHLIFPFSGWLYSVIAEIIDYVIEFTGIRKNMEISQWGQR